MLVYSPQSTLSLLWTARVRFYNGQSTERGGETGWGVRTHHRDTKFSLPCWLGTRLQSRLWTDSEQFKAPLLCILLSRENCFKIVRILWNPYFLFLLCLYGIRVPIINIFCTVYCSSRGQKFWWKHYFYIMTETQHQQHLLVEWMVDPWYDPVCLVCRRNSTESPPGPDPLWHDDRVIICEILYSLHLLTGCWLGCFRSERLEPAKMREELSRQTFGQEGAVGEIVTAIRHFSQPDNVISPNTFLNVET